jgi:hypothetical protein
MFQRNWGTLPVCRRVVLAYPRRRILYESLWWTVTLKMHFRRNQLKTGDNTLVNETTTIIDVPSFCRSGIMLFRHFAVFPPTILLKPTRKRCEITPKSYSTSLAQAVGGTSLLDFQSFHCHICIVIKTGKILLMYLFVLVILLNGLVCRSNEAVRNTGAPNDTLDPPPSAAAQAADTIKLSAADSLPPVQHGFPVTAMKPNISRVTATVKSIVIIDTVDYRITAHIDSSAAIGDMPVFAEPGAEIALTPRYVKEAHGVVNIANERNKRLYSLRSLKEGAVFHGKIVRQPNGDWEIVDIDVH